MRNCRRQLFGYDKIWYMYGIVKELTTSFLERSYQVLHAFTETRRANLDLYCILKVPPLMEYLWTQCHAWSSTQTQATMSFPSSLLMAPTPKLSSTRTWMNPERLSQIHRQGNVFSWYFIWRQCDQSPCLFLSVWEILKLL